MDKKTKHILLLLIFFVTSAGFVVFTSIEEKFLAAINVNIAEGDDGIWRIQDSGNGKNMGTIRANRGKDSIIWHTQDNDVIFIFTKPVDQYFTYVPEDPNIQFEGPVIRLKKGSLKLDVKNTAPRDTLTYMVWVVDADTFVVGNSHPKVIVN